MKRTIFAVCLAVCLLSAGCGSTAHHETETAPSPAAESTTEPATETEQVTETSTEAAAETTAQATTETKAAATEAPTDSAVTEDAPVTEPDTQSNAGQNAPTVGQAQELIRALNQAERLAACGLAYDADSVITVDGTAYYKVTDSAFTGTDAIRNYTETYLTQDMISERYSQLVGGDAPDYLDGDDGLYMKDGAKGFYLFSDAQPGIEKTSEEGYSILADYDNFGAKETADIRVVYVNGTWKICGISFGL